MKKSKKLLAFSLAVLMAASVFAGCQAKEDTPATPAPSESAAPAPSPSPTPAPSATPAPAPVVEDTSTGVVGDGEGWVLWDDEGKLTLEGRGADGNEVVVSSGKYEASQAGIDIIKLGGNGVDAAIAVGFALGVTEPNSSGIGGGGFMTIRSESGETVFLDFRERAPEGATPDLWQLDADNRVIGGQNMLGGKSVAIPGEVAGMWEAFNKYGSGNVTWEQLIQPAITLAEEGFYVTPTLASDMSNNYDTMVNYPEFGSIYLNELDLNYQVGDLFKNPALAKTLDIIAKGGKDAFYTGELAEQMVATINKYGGVYGLADFENYEVIEYEPVKGTYRGYEILSSPLPSSGGTHIVQALNIMENFDITGYGHNSSETLHIMSEAFKVAFYDRGKFMGDPNYVDVPMNALLSKEYAAKQAEQIEYNKVMEYEEVNPWQYEHEDTTHYSVADAAGNMVSVTKTVNGIFGSKVAVGGFMLNNEMGDFSSNATSPNAIAPGKTPLSSMSPTIVLNEDGSPFMILGSPGATRIITTCVQIISNVVDHGMTMQEAIDAPRVFNNATSAMDYENRIDAAVIAELVALGHEVNESDPFNRSFGSVNAIMYRDGKLNGGADPRRDGKALGF